MSKKLYQPNKKQIKKEKLKFTDKIEIAGIVVASAILVTWSGFSVVGALVPDKEPVVHEIMMDEVDSYINNVNVEKSKAEEKDLEEEEKKRAEEEAKKQEEEEKKKKAEEDKKKALEEKEKLEKAEKEKAEAEKVALEKSKYSSDAKDRLEKELADKSSNLKYYATTSVKLRSEPKESAMSYGQYKPGDELEVLEMENSEHPGWIKVKRDGVEGYVSAQFVEKK